MSCQKTNPHTPKTSPYGSKGAYITRRPSSIEVGASMLGVKASVLLTMCLDFVIATFQDGSFFSLQDGTQLIFNAQ